MNEIAPEKTRTPLGTDEGDHEKFKHYVPADQLERAIFEGTPCVALCGKVWTPNRDPDKFPICPECKEKYDALEFD